MVAADVLREAAAPPSPHSPPVSSLNTRAASAYPSVTRKSRTRSFCRKIATGGAGQREIMRMRSNVEYTRNAVRW